MLVYWIHERELIRESRASGSPPPWTADPVLASRRFCNVRREDDRVTRWIRENVREPYAGHPFLWLMLCMCRIVNWPDAIAELIEAPSAWPIDDDFDPEATALALARRAGRGDKTYTAAYVVPAPSERGASKHRYIALTMVGDLWRRRGEFGPWYFSGATLEETHRRIRMSRGWGDFLAYQAVVDMRFCPSLLAHAPDVTTWAAAGPGSIRGLNRIHGRPVATKLRQADALRELLAVRRLLANEHDIDLDLSDVPNVLCEVDKYLRVSSGDGDTRQRFSPEDAAARDRVEGHTQARTAVHGHEG